jgi:hypothetical protein
VNPAIHGYCAILSMADKKKAASTSCLKAMKTIKQCSENRKLETIKSSLYLFP